MMRQSRPFSCLLSSFLSNHGTYNPENRCVLSQFRDHQSARAFLYHLAQKKKIKKMLSLSYSLSHSLLLSSLLLPGVILFGRSQKLIPPRSDSIRAHVFAVMERVTGRTAQEHPRRNVPRHLVAAVRVNALPHANAH